MRRCVALPLLLVACATPIAPPPDAGMPDRLDASAFPAAASLLQGFDAPAGDAAFAPGDRALFGLRLVHPDRDQRWLLLLEAQPPRTKAGHVDLVNRDGSTRRMELPSWEVTSPTQSWTYTAQVGGERRQYRIDSALRSVSVQVSNADTGRPLGLSSVMLPADLLQPGLVPAVTAAKALARATAAGTPPLDQATTEELVRAQVRGAITTLALLSIVQQDSVLADYFWQVVQKPSLWSVLTHFGVSANLEVKFDAAVPATGADGHFVVPVVVEVNGAPAVFADLLVGPSPRPFALCGGIRGAFARYPARDDLRFELVLLAARTAPVAAPSPTTVDGPMLESHERTSRQQP